jgi:hypothetical protein
MTTKWKPLEQATLNRSSPHMQTVIKLQMETDDSTYEEAIAKLEAYEAGCTYWINDLYQVQVRKFYCEEWHSEMMHLNIRRRDGAAIFDWRHRQLIKNQLLGKECEAMEMYPAESRLNDTSNKYHLFGFTDPRVRFPFGIDNGKRDVITEEVRSPPGIRQRRIQKETT